MSEPSEFRAAVAATLDQPTLQRILEAARQHLMVWGELPTAAQLQDLLRRPGG